jgi:NAD(P)-dependent dehydrogenase (short-subunit alcohol dehydrogenase family)
MRKHPLSTQSVERQDKAARLLSLEGKVAMVTGAASGIGRSIAICLSAMGAAVTLLDVDHDAGRKTAEQIGEVGGKAVFLECDVRSGSDCARAVQQTISSFSRVDILCNDAGIVVRKDVTELDEKEWDAVLDVCLKGIYLLSRQVVPHMARNGGGSIINIGSGWSLKGGSKAAAYCAAKGGVVNLTRAMAIDHGRDNIRVNCVCPGDINTPMLASECRQLGQDRDRFMQEAASRPLARVGTPEDVAHAVLFLASDMAKWITGAYLVVDGGGLA